MKEILYIFLHLLIITIFCYPCKFLLNLLKKNKTDLIEKLEIGVVSNIFLLLIASFFLRKETNVVYYFISVFFVFNLYYLIQDSYKLIITKKKFINKEYIVLFFLALIFSVNLSQNLKLGWDAQTLWIEKKLIFTNGGDILDLNSTRMKSYPYLGSFLWFFYSKISILGHEYFGRLFYIFLFLVSIFSLAKILIINSSIKILFSICLLFLIFKPQLFNGYQEILIFSLTIILTKNFYQISNNNIKHIDFKIYFYLSAVIILNILMIKNDALMITFIFLSSLMLTKITILNKLKFFFIILFILLFKYFLFHKIGIGNEIQENNYQNISITGFKDYIQIEKILLIFKYLSFSFLDNITFLVGIIILVFLIKFDKKNNFYLFLSFCYLISLLVLFAVYLLTSFPMEIHLKQSIDRLLFQMSAFFIILFPLLFNYIAKKKNYFKS
jgi:hypothetical protein